MTLKTGRPRALVAGLLLLLLPVAFGCAKKEAGAGGAAGGRGGRRTLAFPVELAPVESRPVAFLVSGVGSVEAFEVVAVTARVAGVVEAVLFSEGARVAAGHPLVEIEPDRYRLSVDSARAAHEKARAQKAEAEAALERRQQVNARNPDLVKAEDVEAFRTQVRVATADVEEKKAQLEMAELNLRDAYVRAPVAGVVQTRDVQTGRYVQTGTVLATMLRRDPLLLRFKVPGQEAAALGQARRAEFTVAGDDRVWTAEITHVAAAASETSRMVDVTARIDDPERDRLRPGAFAEVRVPIGEARAAAVIPQTAVRPTEKGFVAFVVVDSTASQRILTLGLRTPDGRVEVRSGLSPGEMLVVRGAEALREGAKVRPSRGGGAQGAPPAAGAAPGARPAASAAPGADAVAPTTGGPR